MYLDPVPKNRKADLFGFDKEYHELVNAIEGKDRLIIIKGLRRTGKTSLMTVVYNELKMPKIFVDMRAIMPLNQENFTKHFYVSLMETATSVDFLREVIRKIRSIEFGIKVDLRREENTLSLLLKEINEELSRKRKKLVIFVDEAQIMKQILADNLFAYIYDHLESVTIVFAGSEIGIFDKMLNDEKGALFGRPYTEILTKTISSEQAEDFLSIGFRQSGYDASREDKKRIIEKTDGVIGWLTLAGYYITKYKSVEKGLKKSLEIAKKIVLAELSGFLENRKMAKRRYLLILKLLSKQALRWADIKRGLEAKVGRVSNNRFTNSLHALEDYGFICQKEGVYYVADKLLASAIS